MKGIHTSQLFGGISMKTKTNDAYRIIIEHECKKYGISPEPADLDYGILSSVFRQEDHYDPNFCERIKTSTGTKYFNKKDGKINDLVERFLLSDFGTPEAEMAIIDLTRYVNILLRSVSRKSRGIEKLFAKNSKKAFDNSLKEIVWIAAYAYSTGLFLSKKGIFLLINRNNNSDKWNKYLDEIEEVPEYVKEELRFDGGTCRFIEKNMHVYSYKSGNAESEYIKLEAYARHHDNDEESTPVEVIETHTEGNAESSNSSVEDNTDKKEEESLANDLFIITDDKHIHIPLKNTECGYYKDHNFYTNDSYIAEIPKKVGNFYIDILKSIVYQYDGDQYVYIDTISVKLNNNKEDIKAENKKLDDQYREAVYHDKDPVGDILLLPAISSFQHQQTSEEKDEQKTSTDSVQPIKEDQNQNSSAAELIQSDTQAPIQSEYTIELNRITKRKNQEKVYSFGDILKLWREGDNS